MHFRIQPELSAEQEQPLLAQARQGDRAAFESLVEPRRRALFAYIYRMVTHRQDAEDLLQDTLLRALEGLGGYRGESRFTTWLFGIATHVCLDHLRQKIRWRREAQLEAERATDTRPEDRKQIRAVMAQPDFLFEIREHVAFCFACLGRTLPPEEQAALLLREVLEFTNGESARVLGVSEPVLRHRLAAARKTMVESYEGLCQLIHKDGACWQCRGLRELASERNRGTDLVQITVAPGIAVTPESLFEARLEIVREAELENGRSHRLHDLFYAWVTREEEARG